jgi:hypothetical protein
MVRSTKTEYPTPWTIEKCWGRGPNFGRWKILDAESELVTIVKTQELAAVIAMSVNEMPELDKDLAAVWEVYGEGGLSLADGLAKLGRPSPIERNTAHLPA